MAVEYQATGKTRQERILLFDVLRGIAVLGIYWIGVAAFGLPYGANALPTLLGTANEINLGLWASTEILMEGAMRGLFSMLFGASALVFLDELRLREQGLSLVDRFYRRNIVLIIFGLIHAWLLLWPHDVLYAYGLIGMFLFPLRNIRAPALLLAGCLSMGFANVQVDWMKPVESQAMEQPAIGIERDTAYDNRFRQWLNMQMANDIELYRSGYKEIFMAQADTVIASQSFMFYRKSLFDIGGMMLIGMALLKWGVMTGARSMRFYFFMMLTGYAVGGFMRGMDVYNAFVSGFSPGMLIEMEKVNYDLGRLPVALGHIGLAGMLCKSVFTDWLTRALAATGRLALTHYISQTVFSIFLFYGFGFGLFGSFERYELFGICCAVWAVQITFSIMWLKHYKMGPLEWVWRSIIYGKRQSLRIKEIS